MFQRKRADVFKDRREFIEEGELGRANIKREKECERRVYAVLGFLFLATCCFLLYFRHAWNAETEAVFHTMQELAAQKKLLCVSSHHVNATDRNWILMNDGTRVVNLRVLEYGNEQIVSSEVFTHCRQPIRKSVQRAKTIDVAYESESFFHVIYTRYHLASWSDESAICAQHMLDIFEGNARCPT